MAIKRFILILFLFSLLTSQASTQDIEIWGPAVRWTRFRVVEVINESNNSFRYRLLCPSDLVSHPVFKFDDLGDLFYHANDCVTDFSRPLEDRVWHRDPNYPYEKAVDSFGSLSVGQRVVYDGQVHQIAFLGTHGSIILKSHITTERGIGPNHLGHQLANPLTIEDIDGIEVENFGEIMIGKTVQVKLNVGRLFGLFDRYKTKLILVNSVFDTGLFEGSNGELYRYEQINSLNP